MALGGSRTPSNALVSCPGIGGKHPVTAFYTHTSHATSPAMLHVGRSPLLLGAAPALSRHPSVAQALPRPLPTRMAWFPVPSIGAVSWRWTWLWIHHRLRRPTACPGPAPMPARLTWHFTLSTVVMPALCLIGAQCKTLTQSGGPSASDTPAPSRSMVVITSLRSDKSAAAPCHAAPVECWCRPTRHSCLAAQPPRQRRGVFGGEWLERR